jgi:hypothetical protein
MKFNELETKKRFNNKYGNNAYISNYCYYNGTEQISIYVKAGYGASEKVTNVVISEHDLDDWIKEFMNVSELSKTKEKKELKLVFISSKELETDVDVNCNKVELLKENKLMEENEKNEEVLESGEVKESEIKDDFDSMRRLLFESMRMVKQGQLDVEKAKSISSMAQTIINSVKVEIDFLKLTGSNDKPKMIN